MEVSQEQLLHELSEYTTSHLEWQKIQLPDGSCNYFNKITKEISSTADSEFMKFQSKLEALKTAVNQTNRLQMELSKETLANMASKFIDETTPFETFQEVCCKLHCWQFVPEQDRRDIFTNHIKNLSTLKEDMKQKNDEKLEVISNLEFAKIQCNYFEFQSKLLQIHLEMLDIQETKNMKKSQMLREQLEETTEENKDLESEILQLITNKFKSN